MPMSGLELKNMAGLNNIDSAIFKIYLLMIAVVPLIVSSGMAGFQSPVIDDGAFFLSGSKGDAFALHKSYLTMFFTLTLLFLFLYKILFLKHQIQSRLIYWFILAAGIFVLLSIIFSAYKTIALFGIPTRYNGAIMHLCYLFLFFLAFEIKYPENALKKVMYSLIPFTIINFGIAIMHLLGHDVLGFAFFRKLVTLFLPQSAHLNIGSNIMGTLSNRNYLSGFFSALTALFFIISMLESSGKKRSVFLSLSILSVAGMLIYASVSGFVTLIFMGLFIVAALLKSKNKIKPLISLCIFSLALSLLIPVLASKNPNIWSNSVGFFTSYNPFAANKPSESQLTTIIKGTPAGPEKSKTSILPDLPASGIGPGTGRLYIWDRTIELVIARPLTGYGFNTLPFFFPQNDPEKHAKIRTYKVIVDKPHSMFVGILYGTGIIGFIAFLGIFLLSFWHGIRGIWISHQTDFEANYLFAFFAAWVAFLFQSLFNDSVIGMSVPMWIIGGMATALFIQPGNTGISCDETLGNKDFILENIKGAG